MARRGLRGLAAAGVIPAKALVKPRDMGKTTAPLVYDPPAPMLEETGKPAEVSPEDPQFAVAIAINDVIALARTLSVASLNPGVIEMRRRLAVMDAKIGAAEKAQQLETAPAEGNA